MATLPLIAARRTRSALALATALALLFPLPARCASCSTGKDDCPRCVAAQTETAPRACCQQRTSAGAPSLASIAVNSVHQSQHSCGCGFHQAPLSTPPVEKSSPCPEQSAGLIATPIAPASPAIHEAPASDIKLAALIPPIPHRILHCSWII